METSKTFLGLECTSCEAIRETHDPGRCRNCGAPTSPKYDLEDIDASVLSESVDEPGQWRYASLLPFPPEVAVSAAEGATPLVEVRSFADELGVETVYIKDEGRNPTGTVYDRGMSLAVTAASELDSETVALAAAGNAAQSAAAYAGQAELRAYGFVPSRAAFSNKAMVNVHGGEMRVVGGRYEDAAAAVGDELAVDYVSLQEFTTPYRHDGTRTLAFEIVDDLAGIPDAVLVPVATGELLVGLVDGFRTLRRVGVIDRLPQVYAAQPDGCAPIFSAWKNDQTHVEPCASPDTIVGELEIPDPPGGALAIEALQAANGGVVAVSDDDALESAVTAAQREIIEVGGAGGVALAGSWELAKEGEFDSLTSLVVINPDSGVKTPDILRSHLMGKGR